MKKLIAILIVAVLAASCDEVITERKYSSIFEMADIKLQDKESERVKDALNIQIGDTIHEVGLYKSTLKDVKGSLDLHFIRPKVVAVNHFKEIAPMPGYWKYRSDTCNIQLDKNGDTVHFIGINKANRKYSISWTYGCEVATNNGNHVISRKILAFAILDWEKYREY